MVIWCARQGRDGACLSQSVAVLGGSGVYSGDTAQSTINLTPAHSDTDILQSQSSSPSSSSSHSVCQLQGKQLIVTSLPFI